MSVLNSKIVIELAILPGNNVCVKQFRRNLASLFSITPIEPYFTYSLSVGVSQHVSDSIIFYCFDDFLPVNNIIVKNFGERFCLFFIPKAHDTA